MVVRFGKLLRSSRSVVFDRTLNGALNNFSHSSSPALHSLIPSSLVFDRTLNGALRNLSHLSSPALHSLTPRTGPRHESCTRNRTEVTSRSLICRAWIWNKPTGTMNRLEQQLPCTLLTTYQPDYFIALRNKSTKKSRHAKRSRREQEFSDDDEDEDEDDDDMELESGPDFRDLKTKIASLRMDAVLKAGLGISRNKVEAAFYGSKIRVNGEKISKKSEQLHEGDEVDIIRGASTTNPNFLNVSRVVLLKLGNYDDESDKFVVKLRKYPNLLIEKYNDFKSEE